MSLKPLFSTSQSITITLNSLANDAGANSSEISNATNLFMDIDLELDLKGSNAAESGYCEIYILRANATSDADTNENGLRVGTVTLNGTTAVHKTIRVENMPGYWTLRIVHKSSATYALDTTGNSAAFFGVNYQDI